MKWFFIIIEKFIEMKTINFILWSRFDYLNFILIVDSTTMQNKFENIAIYFATTESFPKFFNNLLENFIEKELIQIQQIN